MAEEIYNDEVGYIGWKTSKDNPDYKTYAKAAAWCNSTCLGEMTENNGCYVCAVVPKRETIKEETVDPNTVAKSWSKNDLLALLKEAHVASASEATHALSADAVPWSGVTDKPSTESAK